MLIIVKHSLGYTVRYKGNVAGLLHEVAEGKGEL